MEQVPLNGQKREVLGRKVKNLRKQGIIPAHIFGHKIETIHIQVNEHDFKKVFQKAGETGVVDLQIEGISHPVLIRNVQVNPVTDALIHIDFYQVNLSEKVKVNVPLEIIGDAPAVEKKIGLLLTPVTEVEVEALPTDIPESIQVEIANLTSVGDALKVSDLKVDKSKIEVLAEPELVVVQIGELVTKEMEAVEAEAEAAAAAVEVTEGAEGEEKAEGEGEGEEKAEGPDLEQGRKGEAAEGEEGEKAAEQKPQGETKEEPKA